MINQPKGCTNAFLKHKTLVKVPPHNIFFSLPKKYCGLDSFHMLLSHLDTPQIRTPDAFLCILYLPAPTHSLSLY
jgi:hypothetical protein